MNHNRYYDPSTAIVFHKTKDKFGGLSNMAAVYSVNINDIVIPVIEHIYQASRFPEHPELQLSIISQASPMNAKSISRANNSLTRTDWNKVRFNIMKWCLEVKLSQNWPAFSQLLLSTGDQPIVEWTPKDKIWGAVETNNQLVGVNALG